MPTGPVVRTQCLHCLGPRFNPWSGCDDPESHAAQAEK